MQKTILVLLLLISTTSIFGQDAALRKKHFLLDNGVAINGYDPVSYFSGKPQKGKIAFNYSGIVYQFLNETNLNLFKKNPSKYEPAFGGWCAFAMGEKGKKVTVDPVNFKIVNGTLLLFYKNIFSNTLDDWNENEQTLKKNADLNWKKFQ